MHLGNTREQRNALQNTVIEHKRNTCANGRDQFEHASIYFRETKTPVCIRNVKPQHTHGLYTYVHVIINANQTQHTHVYAHLYICTLLTWNVQHNALKAAQYEAKSRTSWISISTHDSAHQTRARTSANQGIGHHANHLDQPT